jgi:hypothetical protein
MQAGCSRVRLDRERAAAHDDDDDDDDETTPIDAKR